MKKLMLSIVLLCASLGHAQTSKTEWVAIPVDAAASGTSTKALCTAAVKKLYGASLTCVERVTTSPAPPPPAATWTFLGYEETSQTVPTSSTVRYGYGAAWNEKQVSGAFVCGNALFGDPLPGQRKQCELKSGGATTPAPVTGSAKVSWAAPTVNTDGTPLTDLAGYRVLYGPASGNYTASMPASAPPLTVPNLAAGRWFFVVKAIDTSDNESAASAEVSKTIQ